MSTTNDPRGLRFWQAVVTLEASAPLTVGAGAGDDLRDSICVADANGLPTLPGSSLAGALRARWPDDAGRDALFGPERATGDAKRSRLWVGWAASHDARNEPVPYLVPEGVRDDPVLALLRRGTTRDHVRLSPFGTVDREGKFDETLVPRGARFSFELRVEAPEPGEIDTLLALLRAPTLRVGGGTRRGFGAVKAVSIRAEAFDLARPDSRGRWARYAGEVSLGKRAGLLPPVPPSATPAEAAPGWRTARLALRAEAGWRVGGRDREGWTVDGRDADLVPVVEPVIGWKVEGGGTRGEPAMQAFLPGSSIKGALRHRSAFHLRCLEQRWRIDGEEVSAEHGRAHTDGLEALFGHAKERTGRAGRGEARDSEGDIAGRVYVSDVFVGSASASEADALRSSAYFQQHVSLDRFTSAPLAGHLFSEAMLWKTELVLDIVVDDRPAPAPRDRRESREQGEARAARDAARANGLRALRRALRDLCRGRLALGAAGARGHGTFTGSATGALLQEE